VAASFGLLFWLARMSILGNFRVEKTPINIPVATFLVASAIGVVTAVDFRYSLKSYTTLSWLFIFFLTVNNIKDERQFKRLFNFLILMATIAGAYGVFQHLARIDFLGNVKYVHKTFGRSPGFFNSPQTFGNYILLVLPIVIGLSYYSNRKKERWLFSFSSLIILTAMIFSYVRGVWLGLIGGLILMSVLKSKKLLYLVVAGIIVCSISLVAFPSSIFTRRVVGTFKSERPVGDRTYLWQGGLKIVRDYPVTGVGWEGFRKVYPRYKPSEAGKTGCNAHNNFLDVAVNSGLFGLGIFLWLMAVIYKVALQIFKGVEDGYFKGIAWGFLGSFTAFLIAGLSQYNFGDSEVVMLFYFLLGMIMKIGRAPVLAGSMNRSPTPFTLTFSPAGEDPSPRPSPLRGEGIE